MIPSRERRYISIRVRIVLPVEIRAGGWIVIQPEERIADWWGIPQTVAPADPNFVDAMLPASAYGRIEGTSEADALRLTVTRGTLKAGSAVHIVFGDTSRGSTGWFVDRPPTGLVFYLRFVPDLYTFTPGIGTADSEAMLVRTEFELSPEGSDAYEAAPSRETKLELEVDPELAHFGTNDEPCRVHSVFYFAQHGPYRQEWPTHEFCELVSVHEGSSTLTVDGKEYVTHPGSLILVKPFRTHGTVVDRGKVVKGINLSFSAGSLTSYIERLDACAIGGSDGEKTAHVASLMVDMLDETRHLLVGARNCADAQLTIALIDLIRSFPPDVLTDDDAAPTATESRLELCTRYINENFASNLTLEEIAEAVAVSPYHLSRTFSHATGTTISAYITDIRMRHASDLLVNSDGLLRDVALAVGYSDEFYFSKVFKRHFGMPPGAYRRVHAR